jgi:hypothetical protein
VQAKARTLLTVSFLLVSFGMWAQEFNRRSDSDVLARLSFESSAMAQGGGVRHVCVAVSRDGDYRIIRSMDDGQTLRRHGKMPKEQFQQLTKLLGSAEFRALSEDHGGLIRQDAETFRAEIPGPMREHADGESPFPSSVAKVVDWLQQFQPKGGKSFWYAGFPEVCPSGGLRLLQPAVAENEHP